jgi:hypothetical protein
LEIVLFIPPSTFLGVAKLHVFGKKILDILGDSLTNKESQKNQSSRSYRSSSTLRDNYQIILISCKSPLVVIASATNPRTLFFSFCDLHILALDSTPPTSAYVLDREPRWCPQFTSSLCMQPPLIDQDCPVQPAADRYNLKLISVS